MKGKVKLAPFRFYSLEDGLQSSCLGDITFQKEFSAYPFGQGLDMGSRLVIQIRDRQARASTVKTLGRSPGKAVFVRDANYQRGFPAEIAFRCVHDQLPDD